MKQKSAEQVVENLRRHGVRLIACTFVDNAGVTRVKTIPVDKLVGAFENGIGISYVFAVFGINDDITASPGFDTPSGDMRLIPDIDAVVIAANTNGWAWAPVWQYDQELNIMPICQRHFTRRMVEKAESLGITFQMTYEVEFTLLDPQGQPLAPGLSGYSIPKQILVEDFLVALVEALDAQGISVAQLHPEYALGQYEISVGPRSPVHAADQLVLLRQTILRIAQQHGYRVSFSPVVIPGEVGNGSHIHFSAWSEGLNLFTGGTGPEETTETGSAIVAGLLDRLSEMSALWAPSVISYERLQPHHWAGAYTCWGLENREAAIRMIKGTLPIRAKAANFELKSIDGTINPYLVAGGIIAAGLDGLERKLSLPEPIQTDPDDLSEEERRGRGIRRIATSLQGAVEEMEQSKFLRTILGDPLYESYLAVKKFDIENYKDKSLEETARDLLWRFC